MGTTQKKKKDYSAVEMPTMNIVEDGRDAYTSPNVIASYLPDAQASWWLHGHCVSLRRNDGSMLKNILAFPDHNTNENDFYELIRECRYWDCKMPSGYPSPFHKMYYSPTVPWTVNAMFARSFSGGWQEALQPGEFDEPHYRYDIRSAYLWALDEWLPDPETYRHCTELKPDGLYVIEHVPRPELPYPFNSLWRVNATLLEIEVYELAVTRVLTGVSWTRRISTGKIRAALFNLSFWKQAARAYWGRWAMVDQVETRTALNSWKLPSRFANIPWAHLIVGRVRMRLYHEVLHGDVRHVYVDSIISGNSRKISPEIGGFKLEHVYTAGVRIHGPGHYGPMYGPAEKWAGLRKDDPRRTFASINPYK